MPRNRGDAEGPREGDRAQDDIVARRRPDPSRPPEPTVTLIGFLGDSDRAGFRRLYFSKSLDYYCDFRAEDVVHMSAIPADEAPFRGDEATRVELKQGATIEHTRTRTVSAVDEFDLDVRFDVAAARRHIPEYTLFGWTMCNWPGCATQSPTMCGEQCLSQFETYCGICPVPYTVDDPTCADTCFKGAHPQYTCGSPCKRLWGPRHGPSNIETACQTCGVCR